MPNWKKVIVSGSSPHFFNITASNNTKIEGDTSVTGDITGSNIYATSDIFLGSANSFGIRLNNPSQAEFTIGPYNSTTTKYLSVSDSFITIPSTGVINAENTSLAQDNSGGVNSSAAVRFLGGASIAGNISTTSITASSAISASGNITANQFFGDGSQLSNLPFIYEKGSAANSIKPISGSNSATSPSASIGGGIDNTAQGPTSRIGGGQANEITSCLAFIGGGYQNNIAMGIYGSIVGGDGNVLTRSGGGSGGAYSFIGGGKDNASCANFGVVGGGCSNHLDNDTCLSSVVGGEDNHIEKSHYSFIGGGQLNCIKQTSATNSHNSIIGGLNNLMRDNCNPDIPNLYSTVLGGRAHEINSSQYTGILGGCGNKILGESHYNIIAGGAGNQVTNGNDLSFIGGGQNNCISGSTSGHSFIGGGCENVIGVNNLGSSHSIIGGGHNNILQGQDYSGILGGKNNTSVGCNNDNIFIIGSDICVNKLGTTQNTSGCMTYVNNLCAWGTDGTDGTIRACKITQTGEVAIEFKKMASGDSNPIEVESDLQITTGKAIKGASPIKVSDTMTVTASINSGTFTHPAIIASGSEAMQATGSVGIKGILSLPDIVNVSSSLGTNTSNISTNTSNISTNTSNISTNTSNISTNTSNISGKLAKASNLSDVSNAATARSNLGAAKSGANSDITSLSGLTTALSVAQGGTGLTELGDASSFLVINGAGDALEFSSSPTFKATDGTNSAPGLSFALETNTGFYSSGTNEMSISIGGTQIGYFNANGIQLNAGIGTSQIGGHLQAHCLGVGTSPSTVSGEIRAAGDVTANYSSDKRLKKNIKPISSALDKLLQISGVEFDWIEKEGVHSHKGHDVGVIAQEVEEILPEIVVTRDNGYKAVNYEKIVPLLIEAIKDLKAEVDELKKSK